MQVAEHEAKIGHGKLAKDLRDLVDAYSPIAELPFQNRATHGQSLQMKLNSLKPEIEKSKRQQKDAGITWSTNPIRKF